MSHRRKRPITSDRANQHRGRVKIRIPEGALPVDHSKLAPHNSYSPPAYYVDKQFTCRDCGIEEVWSAEQQKWFHETAKGPIYATAVRCAECRSKVREQKELQRQQMQAAEERKQSKTRKP